MDGKKFKVGDRVRVIHPNDAVAVDGVELPLVGGEVGTVTDNDNSDVASVRLDEYPDHEWWFSNRFLERVDEQPTTTVDLSSYETVALEELVDVLNPDDPFERVILDMVATNRRKRADYAVDGSPWSNFDDTANALGIDGFTPVDSVNFNIEQKSARLRSLRKNGRMRDPRNESVTDTYLDRAVYSVIALAMHTYPTGKVEATEEDAA